MADETDKEKKEGEWQAAQTELAKIYLEEPVEQPKPAQAFAPPFDPSKLLEPIRQIQESQQRQAETGRVFEKPPAPSPKRQAQPGKSPSELLKPFSGPGSTPERRRFWNNVREAVLSVRKVQGHNVTINEAHGSGSVISMKRVGGRPTGCFTNANLQVTFAGMLFDCGCLPGPFAGNYSKVNSQTLNATFTVPKTSSGAGFSVYSLTAPASANFREASLPDCSDGGNFDRDSDIIIYCTDGTNGDPPGTYANIILHSGSAPPNYFAAFYAHNPATSVTFFNNTFACNTEITDGTGFDSFGMAHGGTCSIVLL